MDSVAVAPGSFGVMEGFSVAVGRKVLVAVVPGGVGTRVCVDEAVTVSETGPSGVGVVTVAAAGSEGVKAWAVLV